jgi:hypothetical protein
VFSDTVLQSSSPVRELVDQSVARSLFHSHSNRTGSFGNILWSLLVLARWVERLPRMAASTTGAGFSRAGALSSL